MSPMTALSAAWSWPNHGECEMSVAKTDARHLTKLISRISSSSDGRVGSDHDPRVFFKTRSYITRHSPDDSLIAAETGPVASL